MAGQVELVRVAQTLPPKLLRFFARYPPVVQSPSIQEDAASLIATPIDTHSEDPNTVFREATTQTSIAPSDNPNPFKPHKHPETGRWHDPVYSLRRQADLVKLAKAHNIEDLLPYTFKGSQEGARKRAEHGLRVKGTGVGQRVKGKIWERTMKSRLEQRKQAMLGMPAMIQQWKQVILLKLLENRTYTDHLNSLVMVVAGRSFQNNAALQNPLQTQSEQPCKISRSLAIYASRASKATFVVGRLGM
ncbi:MAG: hypothetical protein Q9174_002136 [Haloplaca sp. 1 TL-2023]